MPTEAQLQHLYRQLTQVLDPEGVDTFMDIVSPMARNELATRSDLVALDANLRLEMAGLRVEMGNLKGDLYRMMLMTQGATVAILGLLITFR